MFAPQIGREKKIWTPVFGPKLGRFRSKMAFFSTKIRFYFFFGKNSKFSKTFIFLVFGVENLGFATQNGPNAPQSAIFPLCQPILRPFSPPHYCLRITTDQTLCTGSIPATSCPQCTPRNCSAPQIPPQIWMFLPLGAVGGPFALPNYYLRMSTDQTLCASFTPATSYLTIILLICVFPRLLHTQLNERLKS